MDLINATGMQAAYTMGQEPSAREHLVVAIKGTFDFPPTPDTVPALAEEQAPLIEADEFTGEPGFSASLVETDYPLRKPRCDVLLNGTAYARGGNPAAQVTVALQVGSMVKGFDVIGDRVWRASNAGIAATRPQPFAEMPVSYDRAFGGRDEFSPDESLHTAYMANPVGRGYHKILDADLIDGTPLPNTQERDADIRAPDGNYRPMSFGPAGRASEPRLSFSGTYDQDWIDNVFPFLPADFNDAYHQAAPADQQIDYPRGGEPVALVNLTPEGRTDFRLPAIDMPVVFFRRDGERVACQAVLDTILIEPDARRFMLTWRASVALRRNIFEMIQVLAGPKSRAWWRARDTGKAYYPSLDAVIRARREEQGELVE